MRRSLLRGPLGSQRKQELVYRNWRATNVHEEGNWEKKAATSNFAEQRVESRLNPTSISLR